MKPTKVFDTYWRFAAERQAIFYRRLEGCERSWTSDPILQNYRFTNAYRAADRVSQYLIREVQYGAGRSQHPKEVFFRTLLFKIFNKIETWESLERASGPIVWERAEIQKIAGVLDHLISRGTRIYSSAYIMPSPPFGNFRKHANHLALLDQMMSDQIPDRITQAGSLRATYEILSRYPGLGPFLAFQYAVDLNYSSMMTGDESEFVVAGPGAIDGISKCLTDFQEHSMEYVINWTVDRQDIEFNRLGLKFETLFGRRLQPIDCQNLFCEISKYSRVAHPDVPGIANRHKIKRSYVPDPRPLLPLAFPPRWELLVPETFTHRIERQGRLF
jgi:alpha-glutamyl/putrescinyl thymine pyrophosphorylase clade 1